MKISKQSAFVLVLFFLTAALSMAFISCGGGSTKGNAQLTATQQASASASAAQGAIALSENVGMATGMASGYIPYGYAPGKTGMMKSTAAIANIDPRLKDVVDKMLGVLNKPAVRAPLAKAGSFKTSSAVSSYAAATMASSQTVTCDGGGNYEILANKSTVLSETTSTVKVTYNSCYDVTSLSFTNGSVTASHKWDTTAGTDTATVTINNLTEQICTDNTFLVASNIFTLSGEFVSTNNNGASGLNSALGTFSWTIVDTINGNLVMAFNFGQSTTPVTDSWTHSVVGSTTTDVHTANGSYGLSITAPNQYLALNITLTGLEDKIATDSITGATDEWINGDIGIVWTPDMSQWGCLNGTYTFTTNVGTPIHYIGANCPTSGTVRVNNATIMFGVPAGANVTVTLDEGPTEVFTDCDSMGGSVCS